MLGMEVEVKRSCLRSIKSQPVRGDQMRSCEWFCNGICPRKEILLGSESVRQPVNKHGYTIKEHKWSVFVCGLLWIMFLQLLLARLMDQYCFDCWSLSSSSATRHICNVTQPGGSTRWASCVTSRYGDTLYILKMVLTLDSWRKWSNASVVRSRVVDEQWMRPNNWLGLILYIFVVLGHWLLGGSKDILPI